MKTIFNIDKVKVCLIQPEGFFEKLHEAVITTDEGNTVINYDGFSLFIKGDESANDKDITAKLMTIEEEPFELGTFTFNKSAKYGTKCFFNFSTKAMYATSGRVYEVDGQFEKYNYFNYPFYAFERLGLEFNNVTSLEIACDTEASVISKIQYAVSKPDAFDMILLWKKVQNPDEVLDGFWEYYQRSRKRKAARPTLYIHNTLYEAGNNKGLKVYDKARELAQARHDKEVLTRAWNEMSDNIQRMEITVENKQFKRFFDDICKKYPDKWFNASRLANRSKEERQAEYKNELEHFFYDIGMNESLREEMFEYFSYRLLHFKCRNHEKTQFTLSDLVYIPMSALKNENLSKKKRKK